VTIAHITITGPDTSDLDAQPGGDGHPPRLWIAGIAITTPCHTLKDALQAAEFLQELEDTARRQRERVDELVAALRQRQILAEPDTATEEEFQDAIAREYAEPPRYMIFVHGDAPDAPHTIWSWGSDVITHYDATGEKGMLTVEERNIVAAAVRASAFGPIVSHHGRSEPDEGTLSELT
jgi:hypothetical protein